MRAEVGEIVLLSRRGGEPMEPRAVIALGTGEVRWLPGPPDDPGQEAGDREAGDDAAARAVTGSIARALPEGVVHLAGSRRMGCAAPAADLDLVAALPGDADMADVRTRVRAALPGATRVREVTGARVPGLRLRTGELDVDLTVVPTGGLAPAEAVARRAELGEEAGVALSAVSDAEAVRAAAGGRHSAFARLARLVKAWARARGLDAAPFGGLPGLAWAVLAARTVREAGDVPEDELPRRFFSTWAAWDWREPVALAGPAGRGTAPVTILTPSAPVRNCAEQVGAGGRDLLTQELYQAWELLEAAAETGAALPRAELLAPPPLHRRHAAWAVLTVRPAGPDATVDGALGRVRGRMRALLAALDEAGVPDAHAWPRPFESGPGSVRYAIGLGRTPPGADRLAEITGRWARGLPGVTVTRAECGDVPTLR
ncbi:poly(A) polymerase [Thermocatellispora tengchongensis]